METPHIQANDLYLQLQDGSDTSRLFLVDVREPEEYSITHIKGSTLIPLMEVEGRMDEVLEKSRNSDKTIVICRVGQRSEMVVQYLLMNGLDNVYNLDGGILSYSLVDSSVIRY